MYDFVIKIFKKIINSYSDDFINTLKKSLKDKYIKDDLMDKALEGEKDEEVNIKLKMLVEKVCREVLKILVIRLIIVMILKDVLRN